LPSSLQQLLEALQLFIPVATVFGGIIYYVGRRYVDSYYEAVGIPPAAYHFDFGYYVYRGVSSWVFLSALFSTVLLLMLASVVYNKGEPRSKSTEQFGRKHLCQVARGILFWKKSDPSYVPLGLFLIASYVGGTAYVTALAFGERTYVAQAFVGLTLTILVSGAGALLMTEPITMEFVRRWNLLYWAFIIGIAIAVLMVVHLFPASWGTFRGMTDSASNSAFPTIQLNANQPVGPPDLEWELQGNGSWTSKGQVFLLLDTENNLFLRSTAKMADSFSIPKTEITGMTIHFTGRWASVDQEQDEASGS